VFDASTLSQIRRRRYTDTSVAQDIFDAIVEQAIVKGLVDGTVLYTDSTHLKANANKNRYDTAVVAKSRDYWMRSMPRSAKTAPSTARSRCGRSSASRSRSRPRSHAPTRRAATWCATVSRRASTTVPWTAA